MIEPSADKRQMAAELRQFYIAYRNAGFSEEQAMSMILEMISSAGGEE